MRFYGGIWASLKLPQKLQNARYEGGFLDQKITKNNNKNNKIKLTRSRVGSGSSSNRSGASLGIFWSPLESQHRSTMRGLSEWTGYFRIAPKKTNKSQKFQLSFYGGLWECSKDIKLIKISTIIEVLWPLGDLALP